MLRPFSFQRRDLVPVFALSMIHFIYWRRLFSSLYRLMWIACCVIAVAQLRGLLGQDLGLDHPRCAAILVLLLGAAAENGKIISLIPSRIISLASVVTNKLPRSLPPLQVSPMGFKTLLYTWSTTDAFTTRGNRGEDQSGDARRKWKHVKDSQPLLENGRLESRLGEEYLWKWNPVNDSLNGERTITTAAEREGNRRSGGPSVTGKQDPESRVDQCGEQEILESTERIVSSALSTSLLLDMKAFKEALQRLR